MNNVEYLKNKIKEEGDYKAFEYKGFKCRILRTRVGRENSNLIYLWGYVGLPKSHKLYGHKGFIDNINTNYGVSGGFKELVYQPEKDLWWIGFDCGHIQDICRLDEIDDILNNRLTEFIFGIPTYKDMDFVTEELENLVDELIKKED